MDSGEGVAGEVKGDGGNRQAVHCDSVGIARLQNIQWARQHAGRTVQVPQHGDMQIKEPGRNPRGDRMES